MRSVRNAGHGPGCVNPQPIYFCPTSMEFESPCHGGFDTCCAMPVLHIKLMATDELYAQLALREKAGLRAADELGEAVALLEKAMSLLNEPGQVGMPWWNEGREDFLTGAEQFMAKAT